MLDLPNHIDPDGMNHANMEELKKFLLEERRFKYDLEIGLSLPDESAPPAAPWCGTMGCIAGAVHVITSSAILNAKIALRQGYYAEDPGYDISSDRLGLCFSSIAGPAMEWLGIANDALRYKFYNPDYVRMCGVEGGRKDRTDLGHPLFDSDHARNESDAQDRLAAVAAIERVQRRKWPWPDTPKPAYRELIPA